MEEPTTEDPRPAARTRYIRLISFSRFIRWTLLLVALWWLFVNSHGDIPFSRLEQRYTDAYSRFIEVDGLAAHCRIKGKGQPLLLLHDAQSSLHTWTAWTDTLSNKYQVISVDLPGFGLTGPHPRGSYSAFMYVGFLDSLTKKLGLNRFSLAGNGLGGQIAWQYAAEKPSSIDKLILLCPSGFEKPDNSWVNMLASTPVLNRIIWNITPKSLIRIYLEECFADDSQITDSLVDRHFELFLRAGNRRAFTDRASVRDNRPPVAEMIKKINAPTLVIWGAEDARTSPEFAYEFHQRIKTSDLRIYPNTGHWPQEENPAQSAEDVRAFLEGRF